MSLFCFFLNSSENAVKGDECITRAVVLCKKLVGHFSHTWKGKMALKKAQKEHNLPEHSLITECPTRWGSRQRMIQSSRAAAGHKRRPVSRQKVKTFSSFLAGPRCTWVHKPGIAASARIYRWSIRWKLRKCFICETCTSLDDHLNSCCKGRRQWFNKVHKDEDSRVHEHQVWQPCNSRTSGHDLLYGPQIQSIGSDRARVMSETEATVPQVNVNMTIVSDKIMHYN